MTAMGSAHRKVYHGERKEENDLRGGPTINDLKGVGIYIPPENRSTRERSDFFIHNN